MSDTRPSGVPVVPDETAIVVQELAEIDDRGRLKLLPRWIRRVGWLARAAAEVDALLVMAEPGRVSLLDWLQDGVPIAARYTELAAISDGPDFEALRQIQDKYRRLPLSRERRPYLGDAALAHLGFDIRRGIRHVIYVAVYPTRIDFLSPSYRNSRLLESHPLLDGLAE